MPPLHFETENYVLRTLEEADAAQDWGGWTEEPHAVRMLNIRPQRLSEDQRRGYILGFDGETKHALGMFAKPGGRLVGITTIYIDKEHREFLVNHLVGAPEERGRGARAETRAVLYRHLFEDLGMVCAKCTTLGHNTALVAGLERRGWKLQGIVHRPSAVDGAQLEIRQYALDRDTWRRNSG